MLLPVTRLYQRRVRDRLEQALTYARVSLLLGPRQSGKSTLVSEVVGSDPRWRLVDLGDQATRTVAEADPKGFLAAGPTVYRRRFTFDGKAAKST